MARELDELEFLTNATVALSELGPEDDVFRFVAETLAPLEPDSLVVTTSYDPASGRSTVRSIAGPEDMRRRAAEVGGEAIGQSFVVDERGKELLGAGKLLRVDGGMNQLTFGAWPVAFARRFEQAVGVTAVFGVPFWRGGDFLGAVAFLSRSSSLQHARVIEAFVRLTAIVIQRRRTELRLRDSECLFRMLAENSRDAIFRLRLGPAPAFDYVSPAAKQVTGYSPEELYADVALGADCLYPSAWRQAGELRDVPAEPIVTRCGRRDGTWLWSEQRFTPIRDATGRIVAIEGIVRDVTARKNAEDALREADRRKTEFLGILSHELRNPLGAISNCAHILSRVAPDSAEGVRAREILKRQVAQLARLIDDLLDVTRISRGKIRLQRERVQLTEIARSTVEDHRAAFATKRVNLDVSLPSEEVFIHADRTRVCQILDNLLQNASRFTPPGGQTSVSVESDGARGLAVVRVRNTGVAIPKEIMAHIFEPFVQADRTLAHSKGGLGLGLALVKGLVALHEGSIEVESDDERGTTFTVRLPLDLSTPATRRAPSLLPDVPSERHARVLVMEDNADAANSLRDALELHEHAVIVASSGPEGIEKARTFHPDVVLCDIGLPTMNGYEVARAIRADPELRPLGLVALTGYATPDDVERARAAGFDRHVAKPPNVDVLERVIEELTQLRPSMT